MEYYKAIKLVYEYWFQQFEFPDDDNKPYKSNKGKMVYNDELKREIPMLWECKKLSDISEQEAVMVTPQKGEIYRHYSIPAFDEKCYPAFEYGDDIDSGKYIVPNNAYLVSKLNPKFKRLWIVGKTENNSICSTEFIPFVAKENKELLYAILNSEEFYVYMVNSSSSSTGSRKRMDPELCKVFKFAFPNDKVIIEKFEDIIRPYIKGIIEINEDTYNMKYLRDYILPLILNEKIKIK